MVRFAIPLLNKRTIVRIAAGLAIAYIVVWIGAFIAYHNAAGEYRQVRERSDSATYLVVYTQFHLKSLPEKQRKAVQSPDPPDVPDHMVQIPAGHTPFVWTLLADWRHARGQSRALSEYTDNAVVWARNVLRDATPQQYYLS